MPFPSATHLAAAPGIRHPALCAHGRTSIMKWFTRELHTGHLSDDEYDGALTDYQVHRDALAGAAPEGVRQLLKTSLDDAQVQEWSVDLQVVVVRLLAGDLQRGYQFVSLTYRGAELIGATVDDLRSWSLNTEGELLSDEVELSGAGRYEHRLLFDPLGEFAVRFDSVEVVTAPANPANRRRA
jgi:hypothetical protein